MRLERASQKQSSDTHNTPYDRVKRCREREINIKVSERVNVDVFTQSKRPCPQHSHTQSLNKYCHISGPMLDHGEWLYCRSTQRAQLRFPSTPRTPTGQQTRQILLSLISVGFHVWKIEIARPGAEAHLRDRGPDLQTPDEQLPLVLAQGAETRGWPGIAYLRWPALANITQSRVLGLFLFADKARLWGAQSEIPGFSWSCASKVKERGSNTGDTNKHAWCLIAPTRKACSVSVVTPYYAIQISSYQLAKVAIKRELRSLLTECWQLKANRYAAELQLKFRRVGNVVSDSSGYCDSSYSFGYLLISFALHTTGVKPCVVIGVRIGRSAVTRPGTELPIIRLCGFTNQLLAARQTLVNSSRRRRAVGFVFELASGSIFKAANLLYGGLKLPIRHGDGVTSSCVVDEETYRVISTLDWRPMFLDCHQPRSKPALTSVVDVHQPPERHRVQTVRTRCSDYCPCTPHVSRDGDKKYKEISQPTSELPTRQSRGATSRGYDSSHPVWHALYECLQDIHGDSSPFLLQPFHELSIGFWPRLTSPHPAIQFVPKMFYRVEVGALGRPVQSANIVVGEVTRVHSVQTPQCWEHFIIQNVTIGLCVHATTDKHQRSYAEGRETHVNRRTELPIFTDLNCTVQRHDGNTAHLARRSDEALGVRVSVALVAGYARREQGFITTYHSFYLSTLYNLRDCYSSGVHSIDARLSCGALLDARRGPDETGYGRSRKRGMSRHPFAQAGHTYTHAHTHTIFPRHAARTRTWRSHGYRGPALGERRGQPLKAVHDKVSTFAINLRKKPLPLPAHSLTGAMSDMCPGQRFVFLRTQCNILRDNYRASPLKEAPWDMCATERGNEEIQPSVTTTRLHRKRIRIHPATRPEQYWTQTIDSSVGDGGRCNHTIQLIIHTERGNYGGFFKVAAWLKEFCTSSVGALGATETCASTLSSPLRAKHWTGRAALTPTDPLTVTSNFSGALLKFYSQEIPPPQCKQSLTESRKLRQRDNAPHSVGTKFTINKENPSVEYEPHAYRGDGTLDARGSVALTGPALLEPQIRKLLNAVHDKVSTFEMNLRKTSLPLPAYILTGPLSDMRPVKLIMMDVKYIVPHLNLMSALETSLPKSYPDLSTPRKLNTYKTRTLFSARKINDPQCSRRTEAIEQMR
ncbi:hypothetical protein PR048_025965 [Dryococelus australis]|uniref:Uncharacterized protein n=1 Tax=Dryococelus australis TaxID=614101 RepID=A0ABQ9GJZ3_9NEOP|nr:hypothetical protein PR048_025965 [Dryococelus australis]